jgi:hypothetical protein
MTNHVVPKMKKVHVLILIQIQMNGDGLDKNVAVNADHARRWTVPSDSDPASP